MSALPPKADIRPRDQDVCFGPKAAVSRCSTRVRIPDELDAGAVDERQYIVAEVVFIDLIDLGGGLPDPGLIGTS
jgi:hypothetical protein